MTTLPQRPVILRPLRRSYFRPSCSTFKAVNTLNVVEYSGSSNSVNRAKLDLGNEAHDATWNQVPEMGVISYKDIGKADYPTPFCAQVDADNTTGISILPCQNEYDLSNLKRLIHTCQIPSIFHN
jgi:hypothetical protein